MHARTGVVAAGMYLFTVFYSPGEGPVPFTVSLLHAYPILSSSKSSYSILRKPSHSMFAISECRLQPQQLGSCKCHVCYLSQLMLKHLSSNFIVGITFPRLLGAFKPQGAFGWYAAWK